jgi:hypothetical protein
MRLECGDCLELMKSIPDKSVDMILCDLPYGTTACKWDTIIPFEPLWAQYKRLIGPLNMVVDIQADQTRVTLTCYGHTEPSPRSLGVSELVFFTQLARLATREHIEPLAGAEHEGGARRVYNVDRTTLRETFIMKSAHRIGPMVYRPLHRTARVTRRVRGIASTHRERDPPTT